MRPTKQQRQILGMFEDAGFDVDLEFRKKHVFVRVAGEHVLSMHFGGKVSQRHLNTARAAVNRLQRSRQKSYRKDHPGL